MFWIQLYGLGYFGLVALINSFESSIVKMEKGVAGHEVFMEVDIIVLIVSDPQGIVL